METQPVLCAAAAPPATGRAAPAKPAGLACFPGYGRKGKGGTNGTECIVPQAVRQFPALFCHAGKARLPYLWIVGYLAVSALIANVSVSTTEYSAALFAGQVGLFAVVLPYLFFTLLSLVIGSISSLTSNLCLARIDRNLRRMVWKKVVHLPLQFYEANNPKELLSRITTDVTSISTLIMQVLLAAVHHGVLQPADAGARFQL